MLIGYRRGQGSIVLRLKILNSSVATGAGLTGLTFESSGLIVSTIADNEATATAYTQAGSTIETISTLGTYAAPTATKCRFKEVDSTNHKGVYEIQLADARYAVSGAKSLLVSVSGATNCAETDVVIPLRDLDPYNAKWTALLDGTPSGSVVDDNDPDPTTTAFETDLAEASDDHYNGAFCVFYSGALAGQSRKISDYDGTSKVLTVATAFTEAPAAGDDFLILGRSE